MNTLRETNILPENRPSQEEISSSNHPFAWAILVLGRVTKRSKPRVFHQIWTPNPVPANGSQRPSAPRRFNSSLTSRNLLGKMTSTQISYAEYNTP